MSFTRTVEDFTCERCDAKVCGTGYTNHCPKCLWSKHVDVEPGDRASKCLGMMEPVSLEGTSPEYTLTHRCEKCGSTKRNKLTPGDNMETAANIVRRSH